jgi:hypothetical protein
MHGEPPVARTIERLILVLDAKIARLQEARDILTGGRSQAARQAGKDKLTMSAAVRARISAAQKKRWAAIKKAAKGAAK